MKVLGLYSPSLVLLVWAALLAFGVHKLSLTIFLMTLLAAALAIHVHIEANR